MACPPVEQPRCTVLTFDDPVGLPLVVERSVAKIRLNAHSTCPFPMSVEVEVQDPSSQVVAATAALDQQPSRVSADVSFMPARTGLHLVIARFQPSMEVVQVLVEVAERRPTAEEPRFVDPMPFDPASCSSLGRTLAGSVVCSQRASTIVVNDGGITGQFPPASVFVVGNTVWLAREAQVERYVDDAGALLQAGTVQAWQQFGLDEGFFSDDTAILADNNQGRGPFRWNGQALVEERPQWPTFFASELHPVFALGARAYSQGPTSLCEVTAAMRSCAATSAVLGVSDDAVWTMTSDTLELRGPSLVVLQTRSFQGLRPRTPARQVPLTPNLTPTFDQTSGMAPTLGTVAAQRRGEVVMEVWPSSTLSLGRDFVLLEKATKALTWVRR